MVVPPPAEVMISVMLRPCCLKKPFSSATANGIPLAETP